MTRLRSSLLTLLFKKLSGLSQYVIKSQELGKIINMISNDFNTLEFASPLFFASMISPIMFIGVIIILVLRLGWPGVIPIIVIMILIPLQLYVSKVNGSIVR